MTVALLEIAAAHLGEALLGDVVFVGGATLEALTTDPLAPTPRGTDDVDVVVEAMTRHEYERTAERLRSRGFSEASSSRVIRRWVRNDSDLVLDVMPTNGAVFGFGNRWYDDVMRTARRYRLPSGAEIRIIDGAVLLATKFEAFADRGLGDYYASRDLADIVTLIDGRVELEREVGELQGVIGRYVRERLGWLMAHAEGVAMIEAHMPSVASTPRRIEQVLLPRLARMSNR